MDAKKIYDDVIYLTFNVFKHEKTRTMIILDNEFELKLLNLINDILLLEKDFNMTFKDEPWFAEFGKTFVNIVQKKVKFEKVDHKTTDEVYEDYSNLIVYATKNFEIKRNDIEHKIDTPSVNDLKFYQKVTPDLLSRYQKNDKPKIDIINDNDKIKADTSTGNGTSNSNNRGNPNFNGFIPGQGNLENPFNNDRFYPFRTKQKYNKEFKMIIAILSIITGIALIFKTVALFLWSGSITIKDLLNHSGGIDTSKIVYKDNASENDRYIFGIYDAVKNLSTYTSSIFTILYVGILVYVGIRLFQPVKTYRSYYYTQNWIYILIVVAVSFQILNFASAGNLSYMSWTRDSLSNDLIKDLRSSSSRIDFSDGRTPPFEPAQIQSMVTYAHDNFFTPNFMSRLNIHKYADITLISISLITLVAIIVFWCLNPRLDRQKIMRLQTEMQMQMQFAMQGQKYDIDASLFVPEHEYNEVMNKLKAKPANEKRKDKDLH